MGVTLRAIDTRDSPLGPVLYVKIHAEGYRLMSWSEVWDTFSTAYPGRWAVGMYPPADQLVDGKNVYHLFVCEHEPDGLNIR